MFQSWDGIPMSKFTIDSRVVSRGRKPYGFPDVIAHGAAAEATAVTAAQSAHRSAQRAREAHGEAWSDTWYDGVVLRLIRLRIGEQEAIVRCHTAGTSAEEWPVTEETVNRYRVVEQPPEEEPQRAAMEEERPTGMDAGGDDDLVPPPTEVPLEEAFLDV
eukprot:scaffold2657_cov368-Pavlova_lutheri.AAC.16